LTGFLVMAAVVAIVQLGAHFRMKQRIASLEAAVRKLRALALSPIQYTRDDGAAAALEDLDDSLVASHLTKLGDAREGRQGLAMRWFVDANKTTFGWVGIAPSAVGPVRIGMVMTCNAQRFVMTASSPRPAPALSRPPFSDREVLVGPLDLGAVLAAHYKRRPDDPDRIETLEEAFTAVERVRARTAQWRENQPQAQLLDDDLKAVLGRHYERLGPILRKRLAISVPQARVRT
jgi:hypothetical protein